MITEVTNIIEKMCGREILTRKGDHYSANTIQNFQNVLPWLRRFESSRIGQQSDLSGSDYFKSFQLFLLNNNLAKNSVAAIVHNLHAIVRHDKAISLPELEHVPTELTTAVYTTTAELEFLAALNLCDTPGYDRVRDAYVLHCNVGLRFRDFVRMMRNVRQYLTYSEGRRYFRIRTGKAGEDVVIPINTFVFGILEKRSYNFGEMFSLQYYNSGIKWLGRRAGFTEPICRNITKGGRPTEEFFEKWQLMGSHTARRSFATNASLAGIAESDIMTIGGWRSVTAFRRYLRADQLLSAKSLADHPFFQ